MSDQTTITALELCAGAGGQTLGLGYAGIECVGAVEIDAYACATLRANRPGLKVIEDDVRNIRGSEFEGIDILTAGVPCPPFSVAGKQLGENDERDLFPEALRLIAETSPKAVLLENVPGFASSKFIKYRHELIKVLRGLNFEVGFDVLQAAKFGVSQLRPRFVLIALRREFAPFFRWPDPCSPPPTVGALLHDLMSSRGWAGADEWSLRADGIAPTIVGGSKKHGGPDLGPTRAKAQWRVLCVDGLGIADAAPDSDFPENAPPRLTTRMVARLQGFPDSWHFAGKKTAAYRQIGNAFPPPVAHAVARAITAALQKTRPQPGHELFNTALVAETAGVYRLRTLRKINGN